MPSSQPRMLIVASYYPISEQKSIGTWAHNQARALQQIGWKVDVVSPSPYIPDIGLNLPENIERWAELPRKRVMDEIPIYYPKSPVLNTNILDRILWNRYPTTQNWATWLSSRQILKKLIDQHSYDGILSHNPTPDAYLGRKARSLTDAPLTLMLHSFDELDHAEQHERIGNIFRNAILASDTVATVSEKMVEKARNLVPRDYKLIRNGYNADEVTRTKLIDEQSSLVSGRTIACVGSLTHRKGQDILIEAFHQLKQRVGIGDKYLVLVGDGPKKEKLVEMSRQFGISSNIRIVDNISRREINLLLRDSYVFALPSWNEPCAVVYSETMPYGTPVIATRGEGFSEVITDGENGCLVDPKDPDDLANVLQRLFTNEEEAHSIGYHGRLFAEENLQWRNNARAVADTFNIDDNR